ncbi:MAG: chemotaxis-specific protein-glutamate methyltransferase CheB [Candidatus Obscuribacter sp.]|nr:chemotaxis-specific protein-glutamate methyltransferase CheB [Candidatus Melainabacteria bacterium]MDX1990378.1 chemotaxis-specific protein-glutamate methyltransferase CheB [Candidatus Obscuribacter sp.]
MKNDGKTKVLVVEDSITAQKLLLSIFNQDPALEVIAVAGSGEEALKILETVAPDVVTMDIHMPGMNGLDVTRKIMESKPLPIVLVSESCLVQDVERAFQIIEAGALSAVAKPIGTGAGFQSAANRLKQTVKDMSQVKVVRRWPKTQAIDSNRSSDLKSISLPSTDDLSVVAIGASTGGPNAVVEILSNLNKDFPLPLVLIQHIAPGFLGGMVEWLSQTLPLKVAIPEEGEQLLPGTLYLSKEGKHLALTEKLKVKYSGSLGPIAGHRPAVSYLFESLSVNLGARALGILLTGMGKDGAKELLAMRRAGALTIAQDQASSVVHGMPGEAINLGAASHVLNPQEIGELLKRLAGKKVLKKTKTAEEKRG